MSQIQTRSNKHKRGHTHHSLMLGFNFKHEINGRPGATHTHGLEHIPHPEASHMAIRGRMRRISDALSHANDRKHNKRHFREPDSMCGCVTSNHKRRRTERKGEVAANYQPIYCVYIYECSAFNLDFGGF